MLMRGKLANIICWLDIKFVHICSKRKHSIELLQTPEKLIKSISVFNMSSKRKRAQVKYADSSSDDEKIIIPKKNKPKVKPKKESESSSESEQALSPKKSRTKAAVKKVVKKADQPKKDVKKADKPMLNPTVTSYDNLDFTCNTTNKLNEEWNFKISSWNVDGLRACLKKDGLKYIQTEQPDVMCLQEIKCNESQIPSELKSLSGYESIWLPSQKDGYAGVALLSKIKPLSVIKGLGDDNHDEEGRIITAEFEKFYVVSVYVPNAGRKLVTLDKRLEWNNVFRKFIKDLDSKKPVVICGDMNVAHKEIDLKNPKTNTKNAGFTPEEREGMTEFLSDGYVDSFRELYPDETDVYTFWSYMSQARSKNVGWRLDYFIVSKVLMPNICDNVVRSKILGSDHCPITLFLHI